MPTPIERAIAHLNQLEADRAAAIAVSKEKAQEAKLIKARQEGFQEALEMLQINLSAEKAETACISTNETACISTNESEKRRRRNIPQAISNELTFSGEPMTVKQIAKAIGYLPDRTEKALERMESAGQIMRAGDGRWTASIPTPGQTNGHAVAGARSGLSSSRRELSLQE